MSEIAVKHTGDLLERLKAATGPDRELDCRIAYELSYQVDDMGPFAHYCLAYDLNWPEIAHKSEIHTSILSHNLPRFTASVDAALALVGRKYPGFLWTLDVEGEVQIWHDPSPSFFEPIGTAEGETIPLAILTALLSAISRAEGHYHE